MIDIQLAGFMDSQDLVGLDEYISRMKPGATLSQFGLMIDNVNGVDEMMYTDVSIGSW